MKPASRFGVREYVFVGMLFVIPVVMFMYVLAPRSKASAKTREDTAWKRKQLDELGLVRKQAMRNVKEDIIELEKVESHLRNRVPRIAAAEKAIGDLSQLARDNDLRAKKIRIIIPVNSATTVLKDAAGTKSKKKYEHRELTIELEGRFTDFYSFLQALENFPRIIHVETMMLQKMEQEGCVEARLKLWIFFQREQKKES